MSTVPNDIRFLNGVSLKQYYRNSRNNIEDPIFTGFTVEIDEEHSPLFFGGREYYDYTTSLRSPDGTDTGLANAIESRLKKMYSDSVIGSPDTYEINTLFAKDPFSSSNERKIGYGLQDKFYLDKSKLGTPLICMGQNVILGWGEDQQKQFDEYVIIFMQNAQQAQ